MLKSKSMKWYLGIAVAAVVMWVAGVSGGTILTLAAVGFMVAMHAGGHGGHGGHGGRSHDASADDKGADLHSGHAGHGSAGSSIEAPVRKTATDTDPKPRGGCH